MKPQIIIKIKALPGIIILGVVWKDGIGDSIDGAKNPMWRAKQSSSLTNLQAICRWIHGAKDQKWSPTDLMDCMYFNDSQLSAKKQFNERITSIDNAMNDNFDSNMATGDDSKIEGPGSSKV